MESARAVESEMLGSDSDGLLIGGEPEAKKACSWALLAASRAAAAVCASLVLGEVEKKCAILLAFWEVLLTKLPPFSTDGVKDGQGVGGELLNKEVETRRGMARQIDQKGEKRALERGQRNRAALVLYQAHEYVGSCQSLSGSVVLARLGLDAFRCGGVPNCQGRQRRGTEHRLFAGRRGTRSYKSC